MRRYRFPNGAILIVRADRSALCCPAWCVHISTEVARSSAATALREARRAGGKIRRIP